MNFRLVDLNKALCEQTVLQHETQAGNSNMREILAAASESWDGALPGRMLSFSRDLGG